MILDFVKKVEPDEIESTCEGKCRATKTNDKWKYCSAARNDSSSPIDNDPTPNYGNANGTKRVPYLSNPIAPNLKVPVRRFR